MKNSSSPTTSASTSEALNVREPREGSGPMYYYQPSPQAAAEAAALAHQSRAARLHMVLSEVLDIIDDEDF